MIISLYEKFTIIRTTPHLVTMQNVCHFRRTLNEKETQKKAAHEALLGCFGLLLVQQFRAGDARIRHLIRIQNDIQFFLGQHIIKKA